MGTLILCLRLKAPLTPQSLCVAPLWQPPRPYVCVCVCAESSRSLVSHARQKRGCLCRFWVLWTYLQFCGDALALCHELRDYLCLLPQVLQLLRGKKKIIQKSKVNKSYQVDYFHIEDQASKQQHSLIKHLISSLFNLYKNLTCGLCAGLFFDQEQWLD